jgi:hypothetical protein
MLTYSDIKIPVNIDKMPVATLKLYSAFCWFKSVSDVKQTEIKNSKGIISYGKAFKKNFSNRNKRNYWAKKLTSHGWIVDCGEYYSLSTYKAVWERMGVKKVRKNPKDPNTTLDYRYKFLTINKGSGFIAECFKDIQCYIVDRSKSKISRSIAGEASKQRTIKTALLSSKGVAKILGYKSKSTGHKYREKYYDVVKKPLTRTLRYDLVTDSLFYMYPCFEVRLDKVFH